MKDRLYSYILVALQYTIMAVLLFFNRDFVLHIVPLSLFLLGFIVGIYGINHNGSGNFNITPDIKDGAVLVTSGIYKYVRHPMYLSVALMMSGIIAYRPNIQNISIYLILLLTIFLKASKEERLWSQKSDRYRAYRQKTKMFIPFVI